MALQFSHLEPSLNNIFKTSDPAVDRLPGLFLSVNTMKRLICSYQNGWLNGYLFTQMADLLNYHEEFAEQSGLAGRRVPAILSGDALSEQGDFNHNYLGRSNYGLINGDVPLNMRDISEGESKFKKELKR